MLRVRLFAAKDQLVVLAHKIRSAVRFGVPDHYSFTRVAAVGIGFLGRLDEAFAAVQSAFGGAGDEIIVADRRDLRTRNAAGQGKAGKEGDGFHKSSFFVNGRAVSMLCGCSHR